jgi:hypothetical protein
MQSCFDHAATLGRSAGEVRVEVRVVLWFWFCRLEKALPISCGPFQCAHALVWMMAMNMVLVADCSSFDSVPTSSQSVFEKRAILMRKVNFLMCVKGRTFDNFQLPRNPFCLDSF